MIERNILILAFVLCFSFFEGWKAFLDWRGVINPYRSLWIAAYCLVAGLILLWQAGYLARI